MALPRQAGYWERIAKSEQTRDKHKVLEVVYEYAAKAWKRWLGERHRDGRISHEKFKRMLKTFPLPLPRIVHNI